MSNRVYVSHAIDQSPFTSRLDLPDEDSEITITIVLWRASLFLWIAKKCTWDASDAHSSIVVKILQYTSVVRLKNLNNIVRACSSQGLTQATSRHSPVSRDTDTHSFFEMRWFLGCGRWKINHFIYLFYLHWVGGRRRTSVSRTCYWYST